MCYEKEWFFKTCCCPPDIREGPPLPPPPRVSVVLPELWRQDHPPHWPGQQKRHRRGLSGSPLPAEPRPSFLVLLAKPFSPAPLWVLQPCLWPRGPTVLQLPCYLVLLPPHLSWPCPLPAVRLFLLCSPDGLLLILDHPSPWTPLLQNDVCVSRVPP